MKESVIQQEGEYDQIRFKQFLNKANPEQNFEELSEDLGYPIEEIYLYANHLLYYKKAYLINRLDDFSYFMVRVDMPPNVILLTEQKINKDLEQKEQKDIKYMMNRYICSFLSTQKSWREIKAEYPAIEKNTLISALCQMLVKNLISEVLLYCIVERDAVLEAQDEEKFRKVEELCVSGQCVKEILGSKIVSHSELDDLMNKYPKYIKKFFKYSS